MGSKYDSGRPRRSAMVWMGSKDWLIRQTEECRTSQRKEASTNAVSDHVRRMPGIQDPWYARCNSLVSILLIFSIACITRFDFSGSGSCISCISARGMICQERPNLSFSQPHRLFSPPAESFSQSSSTSSWVSQIDEERNRLSKVEHRAAVQPHELLTFELECHRHHVAFGARTALSVARDAAGLGILEDRSVKVHGLFGLVVEPQKWSDFLHRVLPGRVIHLCCEGS